MSHEVFTADVSPEGSSALAGKALAVLDANWMGHATRPGRLYPHQWSWDAASIAMGRAAWDQARSEQELRSLFSGQWSNGLLPHIIYTDSRAYFPEPEFWETTRSPWAPTGTQTSGIVQPPIHATAAWRLYLHALDRARAKKFLAELLPKLTAWHGYLYGERTRTNDGLAEVWHPWESGMDNSPAWDAALARIQLAVSEIPEYRRIDVTLTDPAQRPSDADYDRYAFLVKFIARHGYDGDRIRTSIPFAIQPVLFNSLLAQSDRDLAHIARVVGADPGPYEQWAELTSGGLEKLWNTDQRTYLDYDVVAKDTVPGRTCAGFAPLYAGSPSHERAKELVAQLQKSASASGDSLWVIPSVAQDDPRFDPKLYWRGPVWPIVHWVVLHGLDRYGHAGLADTLRATTLELCRRDGFWEHYNPLTCRGQGIENFAWTAGLVLDLLSPPVLSGARSEAT